VDLEAVVLEALRERADSGGRLLERMQALGKSPFAGRGVLVYGALANLARRGEIELIEEGPGEEVFGMPNTRLTAPPSPGHSGGTPLRSAPPRSGHSGGTPLRSAPPRPPGFPPSFAMGSGEIALIDREVGKLTRGLRPAWFEELRRVVVADADRRVFHQTPVARAVAAALADLGPPVAARGFLRRVARGGPVPLRLRAPLGRMFVAPVTCLAVAGLLRLFVVGVHSMPGGSSSMAPALIPGVEGGDSIVLTDLLSPRLSAPLRGDIVTFRMRGIPEPLVKRIFALPGEKVAVREGDLEIDGKRLVKERPLLDRVAVPLGGPAALEETASPRGYRLRAGVLHGGYLLPDGAINREEGEVRDIVVSFRVRASGPGETLTLLLDEGGKVPVTLLFDTTGHAGGISVGGSEGARGPPFALGLGQWRAVWFTNADRCLRVELDGVETARIEMGRGRGPIGLSFVLDGLNGQGLGIEGFSIARDLVHTEAGDSHNTWLLGPDEYFVLGDNSAHSRDSRHFGPVRRADIEGALFAVAWPPSRIRRVR